MLRKVPNLTWKVFSLTLILSIFQKTFCQIFAALDYGVVWSLQFLVLIRRSVVFLDRVIPFLGELFRKWSAWTSLESSCLISSLDRMLFRSLTNLQLVVDSERPLLTVHLSQRWPQLLSTATHHDCEFLQELKKLVRRRTYRMTHGLIRNSIPCPNSLSAFLLFPVVISPQHNRTEQRIPLIKRSSSPLDASN